MHQRDENMAPDGEFAPGRLAHLVPGNSGRLLDARRTPVRVVELCVETGEFRVEITAFEDAGAQWVMPLAQVSHLQFALSAVERPDTAELEAAITRFDRPLAMPFEPRPWPDLASRIAQADQVIGRLDLDMATRRGSPDAWRALRSFMTARDLWDMERDFAERFVRNPNSGELVKGHRIVLAELGRVPFVGQVVRDPQLFAGPWSRERRIDHLLSRLAFVRALFRQAGHDRVLLWRGLATPGPLRPNPNRSFVSTSFLREVAESLFQGGSHTQVAMLMRQWVPIERLFMTSMETQAMNQQYQEAEAVLFYDPENLAF